MRYFRSDNSSRRRKELTECHINLEMKDFTVNKAIGNLDMKCLELNAEQMVVQLTRSAQCPRDQTNASLTIVFDGKAFSELKKMLNSS